MVGGSAAKGKASARIPRNVFADTLESVFKHRSEEDKNILKALLDNLRAQFGEQADFKNASVLMSYFHRLEDLSMGVNSERLKFNQNDVVVSVKPKNNPDQPQGPPTEDKERQLNLFSWNPEHEDPLGELNCSVCLSQPVNMAFVPCGHLIHDGCSAQLLVCHMCRTPIVGTVYISF